MKTTGITIVLLAALSIANGTLAQKIPAKTPAVTAIPDFRKFWRNWIRCWVRNAKSKERK